MHLNALLDLDLVAVESEDQIHLLLELQAPERDRATVRPPGTLQVALDRSASMGDGRLEAAKQALHAVVDRLSSQDQFGVVCFDDTVQIQVPAGPLANKEQVHSLIALIEPGGMTNMSSGLVRGIEEARRVKGDGGATLLMLSDGHANTGVSDPERLTQLAATGHSHGVSTSTIGIGLGYDEQLLQKLARGGSGNHHFAEQGDEAGAAVAEEVGDLLDQVAQAASLTVSASDDVGAIRLFNDLATAPLADGFLVELGDFYAGEERRVVLEVDVPAMSGLGLKQVCELALRWTDADSLESHTITVPVHVNVVPGDEAAERVANPTVQSEVAFQKAQEAKREAGEALRAGDAAGASALFNAAGTALDMAAMQAPPQLRTEVQAEAGFLREMAERARVDDTSRVSKVSEADRVRKSRRRGSD